jgi:hypothetical protein
VDPVRGCAVSSRGPLQFKFLPPFPFDPFMLSPFHPFPPLSFGILLYIGLFALFLSHIPWAFGCYSLSVRIFQSFARSAISTTLPQDLDDSSYTALPGFRIPHCRYYITQPLLPFRCHVSLFRVLHSIPFPWSTLPCIIALVFVLFSASFF